MTALRKEVENISTLRREVANEIVFIRKDMRLLEQRLVINKLEGNVDSSHRRGGYFDKVL